MFCGQSDEELCSLPYLKILAHRSDLSIWHFRTSKIISSNASDVHIFISKGNHNAKNNSI